MELKSNKLAKAPKLLDLTRHKPMSFKALAPAKINLFLHIVGKRQDDGYHLLESLMTFADIGDEIVVRSSDSLHLELKGPFAKQLWQESMMSNIVMKAAKNFMQKHYDDQSHNGATIVLKKQLPIGAGLGGGSSDAATAIMLLARLWGVDSLTAEELLTLGADVPICMEQCSAMVSGIGESIRPVSIPGPLHILLVHPNITLTAVDVYKRSVASFSAPQEPIDIPQDLSHFIEWLCQQKNDLEEPAIALVPEISDVLKALDDSSECLLSRMSGSGTACFGLYPDNEAAICAASQISRSYPEWWVKPTIIH